MERRLLSSGSKTPYEDPLSSSFCVFCASLRLRTPMPPPQGKTLLGYKASTPSNSRRFFQFLPVLLF